MDYSELDKVRRSTTPLQLDIVESFAGGRLEPSRVHHARHGRRPVDGVDQRGHRGLQLRGQPVPDSGRQRSAPAAPTAAGSGRHRSRRPPRPRPAARSGSPASDPVLGRPGRDDGPRRATASPPSRFEFLCTLDSERARTSRPGLALSWTPNADSTVWTFKLRQGVTWQTDGSPFTADDVVATMERLVTAGNSGLKGVLDSGGAVATDPNTVTFTLVGAQRQLPVPRVGLQRPDADHPEGVRRGHDSRQGARRDRRLEAHDATTSQSGATFVRNDAWWGGKTPLDGTEFIFFDDTGPMVTAYQGGQIDAIVQFDVLSGASALHRRELHGRRHTDDQPPPDLDAHRHGPVRRQAGPPGVRPDVRPTGAHPDSCSRARRSSGNDHVIWQFYPYFDPSVTQRAQDIDKAKSLLSAAGVTNLTATLQYGQLHEIPDLATLLQSQASQAGITINVAGREPRPRSTTPSGAPTKPTDPPCSGAAEFGIVDYGHRATPDVFLNSAFKTKGVWNSSQYSSPAFDAAFTEFQTAVGVDAQKAACTKIEHDHQRRHADRDAVLLQLPVGQLQEVHRRLHVRARADVLVGGLQGRLTRRSERADDQARPSSSRLHRARTG